MLREREPEVIGPESGDIAPGVAEDCEGGEVCV